MWCSWAVLRGWGAAGRWRRGDQESGRRKDKRYRTDPCKAAMATGAPSNGNALLRRCREHWRGCGCCSAGTGSADGRRADQGMGLRRWERCSGRRARQSDVRRHRSARSCTSSSPQPSGGLCLPASINGWRAVQYSAGRTAQPSGRAQACRAAPRAAVHHDAMMTKADKDELAAGRRQTASAAARA